MYKGKYSLLNYIKDVVYFDFAKAFDSVNHRSLLAKLESFGLCDEVVRFIRQEETTECKWTSITSGVPISQ